MLKMQVDSSDNADVPNINNSNTVISCHRDMSGDEIFVILFLELSSSLLSHTFGIVSEPNKILKRKQFVLCCISLTTIRF